MLQLILFSALLLLCVVPHSLAQDSLNFTTGYIVYEYYSAGDDNCTQIGNNANGTNAVTVAVGYPVGVCISNEVSSSTEFVWSINNATTVITIYELTFDNGNCTGNYSQSIFYTANTQCKKALKAAPGLEEGAYEFNYGFGYFTTALTTYNSYAYAGGVLLAFDTPALCAGNSFPYWRYIITNVCGNGMYLTCENDLYTMVEYNLDNCTGGIYSYVVNEVSNACVAQENDYTRSNLTYNKYLCTEADIVPGFPTPIPVSAPTFAPTESPVVLNFTVGYVVYEYYTIGDDTCSQTGTTNGTANAVTIGFGYPVGNCEVSGSNSTKSVFGYAQEGTYISVFVLSYTTTDCTGSYTQKQLFSFNIECKKALQFTPQYDWNYGRGYFTASTNTYDSYTYSGGVMTAYETEEECTNEVAPYWKYTLAGLCANGFYMTCSGSQYVLTSYQYSNCTGAVVSMQVEDTADSCIAGANDFMQSSFSDYSCTAGTTFDAPSPMPVAMPTHTPTVKPTSSRPTAAPTAAASPQGFVVFQYSFSGDTTCNSTSLAWATPVGVCNKGDSTSIMYVYESDPDTQTIKIYENYYYASKKCTGQYYTYLIQTLSTLCQRNMASSYDMYGFAYFTTNGEVYNSYKYTGGVSLAYTSPSDCQNDNMPGWIYLAADVCVIGDFLTCGESTITMIGYSDTNCMGSITSYRTVDMDDVCVPVNVGNDDVPHMDDDSMNNENVVSYMCTSGTVTPNFPTPFPVSAPTFAPTFVAGTTVVAFNAALALTNTTAADFNADSAAQTATINATVVSIPGIQMSEVSIVNVVDLNSVFETFHRALATSGVNITFLITASVTQLNSSQCGAPCSTPEGSYDYMSTTLSTAVDSGAYTTSLSSASIYYDATATASSSTTGSVQSFNYETYVATASPTHAPTHSSNGSSDSKDDTAAIAGGVVGGIVGAVLLAALIYYFAFSSPTSSGTLSKSLLTNTGEVQNPMNSGKSRV